MNYGIILKCDLLKLLQIACYANVLTNIILDIHLPSTRKVFQICNIVLKTFMINNNKFHIS